MPPGGGLSRTTLTSIWGGFYKALTELSDLKVTSSHLIERRKCEQRFDGQRAKRPISNADTYKLGHESGTLGAGVKAPRRIWARSVLAARGRGQGVTAQIRQATALRL